MTGFVLSRRQVWLLVFVTLFWGVNWPIMKSAVGAYPAMAFRAWSMVLGLPCLWVGLKLLRVPLQVPRRYWGELLLLATTNMVAWHLCLMWALPGLSSGRAAIIGYTMPVFSALWGMLLYRQRLSRPQWVGVGSATAGVVLLLWHEFSRLSGVPLAGLTLLAGTAVWALGTQQLRRSTMDVPVLILGGFESIPGAVIGGLIIGASEKLAEVYIGPHVGGGIEGWFPYVLALLFLLVRPEGLFGEKHIDRV